MSDVEHDKQYAHRVTGAKRQSGRFKCNGTDDPAEWIGEGFTVTNPAGDYWLVTFDAPYRNILSVSQPAVQGAAVAFIVGISDLVDGVDSNAAFQIHFATQDGATGLFTDTTLPVDADGVWIHFGVDFYDVGGR